MSFKKLKGSKFASIIITWLIRLYIALVFCTCKFIKRIDSDSKVFIENKVCMFALWHGRIMVFPKYLLRYGKFTAVVSAHKDGEFLAQLLKAYQHKTARGSSRKEGFKAMKELLRTILQEKNSICITPDGPKGPRFQINGNITTIAAKHNIPIIPMSFSATKAIVLNTWDRFVIPLPFSKIFIEIGKPIYFDDINDNNDKVLAKVLFKQMVKLDKESLLKVEY